MSLLQDKITGEIVTLILDPYPVDDEIVVIRYPDGEEAYALRRDFHPYVKVYAQDFFGPLSAAEKHTLYTLLSSAVHNTVRHWSDLFRHREYTAAGHADRVSQDLAELAGFLAATDDQLYDELFRL